VRHTALLDAIRCLYAIVGNVQESLCLLGGFAIFAVFFPCRRILRDGSFVTPFEGGEFSLPRLLFEQRLEPGRDQSPLALRQMAAVQISAHDESERRAALPGIGAEARRHMLRQAGQVTVPAFQDLTPQITISSCKPFNKMSPHRRSNSGENIAGKSSAYGWIGKRDSDMAASSGRGRLTMRRGRRPPGAVWVGDSERM
jgi:hypothetical protein